MKLKIGFTSTHCNTWPTVNVILNGTKILDTQVIESFEFETNVDIFDSNKLEILMVGKQFGPVWDTILQNGQIVQDKTLSLVSCEFDEVDIITILKYQKMHVLDNSGEDYTGHKCKFHYNSTLSVDFTNPVYNWIITEKFIKVNYAAIDDKSFGSWKNKFNYEATKEYLDKIQKLL